MNEQKSQLDTTLLGRFNRRRLLSTFGIVGVTEAALTPFGLSTTQVSAQSSPAAEHIPQFLQSSWNWCNKCQGLFFAGGSSSGVCPAWGAHSFTGSGNYILVANDSGATGQHNWRWCLKCQGLFFAGNPSQGRCPAGQAHNGAKSGNYTLSSSAPGAPGQDNWRWCHKCQGLFFAGNIDQGICPAWDAHDTQGSGDYILTFV